MLHTDPRPFGVMLDVSRNAVMTVPRIKEYVARLHKFGYNTLMLYTEDTYEIEGEPYFGHKRGRYSVGAAGGGSLLHRAWCGGDPLHPNAGAPCHHFPLALL